MATKATKKQVEENTETDAAAAAAQEAKKPAVTKERVHHYKEMGLESSQVIIKKIATSIGFPLNKKGRSGSKGASRGASTAARSGSAGKAAGLARKKTAVGGAAGNGLDFAS